MPPVYLPTPTFGLDYSNYGGFLHPSVARCFKENGQTFVIPGTQDRAICRQQLDAGYAVGIARQEAYGFLRWHLDPQLQMLDWLETIKLHEVGRLWIDAEEDPFGPGTPPVEEVRRRIAACRAAGGTFPMGIYTGRFWWIDHTGNWTEMSDLPLWHASQFVTTIPTPAMFTPYGDWPMCHTWQHRGSGYFCGYGVDQNVRFLADEEPALEDHEMIPHLAIDPFFTHVDVPPTAAGQRDHIETRAVLGVPPDAALVRISFRTSGTPRPRFYHGNTDAEAVIINGRSSWHLVDVYLDDTGRVPFVCDNIVKFRGLTVEGYWRKP